jgi:hypothetical protein
MSGFLQVDGSKIVRDGKPILLKGQQGIPVTYAASLTIQALRLQDGVRVKCLSKLMKVNMENFIT